MKRRYQVLLFFLVIFLMFFILWSIFLFFDKDKKLMVSFLDIGQGDSTLIQTPYGQNILIDGGPDSSVVEEVSKRLPIWDKTIDLMILTHPHDDHVFGLIDILKRYRVKKILYTGVLHPTPGYVRFLKVAQDRKVAVKIIDMPQVVILGDDCYLDIVYPRKSFLNKSVENLNNTSIVAKLVYGSTKFLLTGDIEKEVENELLDQDIDVTANIVKIAHHGSDTSTAQDFLQKVDPDIAIISVGVDNQFNHPNGRIIKRLERFGVRILRTDIEGSMDFISDGVKIFRIHR